MYKHKIIVSPSSNHLILEDKLDAYLEKYFPDTEEVTTTVITTKDKLANSIAEDIDSSHYLKSQSFVSDAAYLEQYFASKNKPRKDKKKKKGKKKSKIKEEPILIRDILYGSYEDDADESDNSYATPYGTLLLSGNRTKEMEMYHRLNEAGWNSYKIMKNSKYSKREINMFKPVKKAKKNKKNKKAMKQLGVEDTLVQILGDMGYDDYEDYAKEMLTMTSSDIFK